MVWTLTGPVDADALGPTLMHEHLTIFDHNLVANYPQLADRDAEVAHGVDVLRGLASRGIRTIIDPTTVDLGRDVEFMHDVAERSEVRVIGATGIHMNPPRYFRTSPIEAVVDCFVHDLSTGIGTTGIRAGVVKLAAEAHVLRPDIEKCWRAGARAHRATGVPIVTHSGAIAGTGAAQQTLLADEGVDLSRVIIGHSGDSSDLAYLKGIMERGSYIGLDRFGLERARDVDLASNANRIETVVSLCRDGYAERMVLSHDAIFCIGYHPPLQAERAANPDWQPFYISDTVLPALRAAGVTEAQIGQMLTGNIAALFQHDAPY